MREILFRGKTLATESKWVEGFYNHIPCGRFLCDEHCIQTIAEDGRIGQLYDVYESTVGQFTGLTDKNGKKIFEGDIVHYVYEPGEGYWNCDQNSIVKWREPGWYMEGIKGTNKYALMCGYLTTVPYVPTSKERENTKVFEVIGNIHDNPELLEVKHEN